MDRNNIENFRLVNSLKLEDESNPVKSLSIEEQLPNTALWTFNNNNYCLENNDKLIAHLLNDHKHIAVVESPFYLKLNKAYIINGEKKTTWNISALFKEKNRPFLYNKHVYFSDTYYIGNDLYFFVVINNLDFRFHFDIMTGVFGELIESR